MHTQPASSGENSAEEGCVVVYTHNPSTVRPVRALRSATERVSGQSSFLRNTKNNSENLAEVAAALETPVNPDVFTDEETHWGAFSTLVKYTSQV